MEWNGERINMPSWDGQKRRTSDVNAGIHDLVIRIDENVKALKENFILHKEDLVAHKEDDDKKFRDINKRITPLEQAYWKMTGILALLIILSRMIPLPWK